MIVAAMFLVTPTSGHAAVDQDRVDHSIADAKSAMFINPAQALAKAVAAKRQSSQLPVGKSRAISELTSDWLQAEALVRLDKATFAIPIAEMALQKERKVAPRSKLEADTLLTLGGIHGDLNQVNLSLLNFQEAFRIYRFIGFQRGETIAILDIAELYLIARDYDSALKYSRQVDQINNSDGDLIVATYNNRAMLYEKLGRFHDAEVQFDSALKVVRRIKRPLLAIQLLRNLAQCQLMQHNLSGADHSIAEGRAISVRAGIADEPLMLSVMAQAALQHGRRNEARTLVDRAFAGIDPTHTALSLREAHQTAYDVYRAIGRPDLAIVHLAALKRLDDQATKLATTTSTALMAAQFDFAKIKADELQRSVEYERQKAKTDRFAFLVTSAAAAIVMVLLAFALFTSRRSRKRVDAANDDLAQTNTALGKALAAKTEFLATTSHEIRTPLNGILGMTQVMLADARVGGDTRDRLGVVHAAGITMRALVDDILDVAKMETGNLTIEHAPFDLAATIRDAARLWEDQAAAKGIAFSHDLDRCPHMIEGDAARVRQITFNLLSNALKFTPTGSIALVAETEGRDRYRIAITDTGIGIAADKTTEIFESFRQADAGTTRQFGGTGLGLAICRNLARAMGGDISVESAVGQGSTFAASLPLVHAAPPIACETVGQGGPGILIVDRNPISRAMLRALLAPSAGTVAFASSAGEATACLPVMQVAHVLVDDATIRAEPDFLAALALLAEAARAKDVATSLLWPIAAVLDRDALIATGIDQVIAKPVTGSALVDQLFGSSKPSIERLVSEAA